MRYNKIVLIATLLIGTMCAYSAQVINTTADGTKLKCTFQKTEGSIQQFDKPVTAYYTFKDGKLYSRDFFELFASSWRQNYKKGIPRVLRLKVTDEKIKFSEYCGTDTGTVSKRSEIDRKTGAYTFKAERLYHWSGKTKYYKKAKGSGKCVIVK